MGPNPLGSVAGGGSASLLDGPPPHPQMQSPFGGGGGPGMGMGAPASRALSPEIIQGILQAGQSVGEMLDTMAQTAPDSAAGFAAAKDLVMRELSKLMVAGGGVTAPGLPAGPIPGATPGPRMA